MSDEYEEALAIALKRLQASDRLEADIRKALARFSTPTVDRVVAYLQKQRFLDDARGVSTVVERNVGRRAVGSERLRERLEAKGAPADVVAGVESGVSDLERALSVLEGKFRDRSPSDRGRAGRFLFGRGFSEDDVESALDRHFGSDEP